MAENKAPENTEPGNTPGGTGEADQGSGNSPAEPKSTVRVVVDKTGTVEVLGPTDPKELAKVAERLGLKSAGTLVRQEATPQVMEHVIGRSRILGYDLVVVDPEAVGADAAGPISRPPRRLSTGSVVGFVTIPAMVLALGAVLTGIGTGIRDELVHEYSPVASLRTVESMVEHAPPAPSWYKKLLNPDDTRYVALPVQDAMLLGDKEAIWDGHLVTIPELAAPSIKELVGNGGNLVFRLDTRKSEPNRLYVEEILRNGEPTGETKLWMNLKPIAVGPAPVAQYGDGSGILFDSKDSFEGLDRFRTGGLLQKTDAGFRITGSAFRVALTPDMTPELAHFLEPFIRPAGTAFADEGAPPPPLTFYLSMREVFPWSTDGTPDRRQTEQEIGMAHLDGVQLGDMYLANRPG
jgi:hypothetical protein